MKQLLTLLLLAAMFMMSTSALAETISLDGVVVPACTSEVYAASTAIVQEVHVAVGQTIQAGDAIATLRTTKVYAEEDGVVTAVFAQSGDLGDNLTARYGAALSIQTAVTYAVSATTDKAYDSVQTKLITVGENVYLRSRNNEARKGTAIVTAVEGTAYTLHVTEGDFIIGETVEIFRTADLAESACLGRGDVARNAPMAVTAAGRIVQVHVQPGDEVRKGDLLLETLTGSGEDAVLRADVSGVVAALNINQGEAVTEDAVAAVIWPSDAMQIEASIHELDLANLTIGDEVELTFDWNEDSGETMKGVVQRISAISDGESSATVFSVVIAFTPDENTRYGMNVTITTME